MSEARLSVTDILLNVTDQICEHYCKWPDYYQNTYKDIEDAEEKMLSEKCDSCPLNQI